MSGLCRSLVISADLASRENGEVILIRNFKPRTMGELTL